VRSVVAKDSLDLTDTDRQALEDALDDIDTTSVVITHGTDTLTVTAEYLSQRSSATSKIIALTGSLQSAAMAVSDAALNLGAALMACQTLPSGVYVCIGGRAFAAGHVRKDSSSGQFLKTPQRAHDDQ
jgi:L-asparaginase